MFCSIGYYRAVAYKSLSNLKKCKSIKIALMNIVPFAENKNVVYWNKIAYDTSYN